MSTTDTGIRVTSQGHIGIIELARGPHNYFDDVMVAAIAEACERFEADASCRVILLCAEGKSFCAGANFGGPTNVTAERSPRQVNPIYNEALRIFACTKPIVAAVQGPAIGGGLGVALVADFRIACPEARFSANFNRLGIHPGFGLSHTLPALVGKQQAALLFYTGKRINGEEALAMGLADELVPQDQVRERALALAQEIATSSPGAVQSTRATLQGDRVEKIRSAVARESAEQAWQFKADDFKEGVQAMAERREPRFA
ncbi:enoyl-CoA hydratase [Comamonas serinivorans]|uniref:Enoyl-CoA hydratase n=1 Tax=Comamonas serinivorans TaxID=1082851 RepID=A0A1Y0EJF2_9BURK|nr:enoyl-CoA hydratase/isomerase family protein [Comamonas serinivorans]ARU03489.1 enoyl-CoA hydratase [Comamonas serinivorans]